LKCSIDSVLLAFRGDSSVVNNNWVLWNSLFVRILNTYCTLVTKKSLHYFGHLFAPTITMVHRLIYIVLHVCLWTHGIGWGLTRGLVSRPVSRYRHVCGSALQSIPIKAEVMNGWNTANKELFVSKYLQKQPVLIRNAFPDIQSTVKLNFTDLSELASDEDVETRVFTPHKGKYTEKNGPFT